MEWCRSNKRRLRDRGRLFRPGTSGNRNKDKNGQKRKETKADIPAHGAIASAGNNKKQSLRKADAGIPIYITRSTQV
jgi:hypothetical protein